MLRDDWLTHETKTLLSQYLRILDSGTKEHNGEVVSIAQALGRLFHLSDSEHGLLIVAAKYHDLGKGDPEISALIRLPRKLTSKERRIVDRHALISGLILQKAGVRREIINLVMAHHDPVVYSGDFLLVLVLLAMADMIQATTSKRPYRTFPLPRRDVAEELIQKLGDMLAIVGGESSLEDIFTYLVNIKKDESPSLLWSPGM